MDQDGGGGRSAVAAAARKKKDKNDAAASTSTPRHPVPFTQMPGISGELRERLEELELATEPSFMIAKSLKTSDVKRGQARLLFSCKREAPSQLTAVFTETEMRSVEDKVGGLLVAAFDRAGRRYDLTCKYLDSNAGYRFITGWTAYVVGNGLGAGMRVELWWFRSRKLPNRYELRETKGNIMEKVPVAVESGHPDGSLALVLLHYENEPLEAPPVQETETETESKTTTTAEDKLGTCAEPIKSKTTIADDDEIEISTEDMLKAARGLLMLREHYGRVGRDGQGRAEPES